MGLTERDSDGFRLMPDGRRLTINFTMDTIVENQWRSSDQTQIIAQQWKDIGVELNFNLVERSLLTEMAAGNEHEGTMWAMTIPYLQYLLSPQHVYPAQLVGAAVGSVVHDAGSRRRGAAARVQGVPGPGHRLGRRDRRGEGAADGA